MFATFILVIFYRYDSMLADYSVAKKCQQAFWRRCWGSQLLLSICRVNKIKLVNTISLCRIIFYSVLFVVLIEMC
jgi:hypothetical protein